MRQFVAIMQPVVFLPTTGAFVARPPMVCRGELPATSPFTFDQLPRDRMLALYCEKYPEHATVAREFIQNNKQGGISHLVWDGSVKDLFRQTPKEQRKNIKELLRAAVRL